MLDRCCGPRILSVSHSPFTPKPATPLPLNPSKIQVRRLTAKELAVHRDQGLCYHCDDKWSHGHRCMPRLHLLIDVEPISNPVPFDPPYPPKVETLLLPQISLNAMEGSPAPQTFRLLGSLRHHQVTILVDGGSTYNFIQSHVAKFLSLSSTPTTTLHVMVGNIHTLDCDTLSVQVPISI